MAGRKGRSGRKSTKTIEQHKLEGTYNVTRHRERDAAETAANDEFVALKKRLGRARMNERGNPLDAYASAVATGKIPAGRLHRLAAERHLRDRRREKSGEFPYRLDFRRVARIVAFAKELKHYKGEWAGKPIALMPYQVFRLGSIFGWVHKETGLRRFRLSYSEIPRKNGKSLEAAIVQLYGSFFDGEPGAEGYCLATKRDQAKIVFNDCRQLVIASGLRAYIEAFAHNLHCRETSSKVEAISADSKTLDGLNTQIAVTDELHAHPTRRLIDVVETSMGARRQPHHFQITTAGDNPVSPCGDQHDYARQILEGLVEDESFFAFIAHADEDDDWTTEAAWRKANPNFGVSLYPKYFESLVTKAKAIPAAAAEFKQKHLNWWVNATAPCLSVDGWRRGQSSWELSEMLHESCFAAIDLASKIDLATLSLVFPPCPGRSKWRIANFIWTPADTLIDRAHRDRAPYDIWVEKGWLLTTPGTRIDQKVIKAKLLELRTQYDIERVGFDPWHADMLIDELIAEGFTEEQVLEVPQTFAGMSSGCLEMQAEILGSNVDARGCPVTAWSVSNVVGQKDGKENLMFAKGKSRGRIDPVIAPTIGMALWKKFGETPADPYLTRGVRQLGA